MLSKPHEAQSLSIELESIWELTIVDQYVVMLQNVYLICDFYFTSGKG